MTKSQYSPKKLYKPPNFTDLGPRQDTAWLGFRPKDQPKQVEISSERLIVTLQDERIISTPLAWYPILAQATKQQQKAVKFNSFGLYWDELNLIISVHTILCGRPDS